jgi:lipopolysaccharide/colanic/teichoic acid biosynthesis glycosyltransferase
MSGGDEYRDRLEVPPGITGYWQVLGSSCIPLKGDGHARLPLHRQLVGGELMLRTVPVVVNRRGL